MKLNSILVGLGVLASMGAVQAAGFQQEHFNQALKNAASKEGADYDEALTKALQAQPKALEALGACRKQHPGRQSAFGYLTIQGDQSYTVDLNPNNAFSTCLTKALSGHKLPAPPRTPWYNEFKYSSDPMPKAPAAGASAPAKKPIE